VVGDRVLKLGADVLDVILEREQVVPVLLLLESGLALESVVLAGLLDDLLLERVDALLEGVLLLVGEAEQLLTLVLGVEQGGVTVLSQQCQVVVQLVLFTLVSAKEKENFKIILLEQKFYSYWIF